MSENTTEVSEQDPANNANLRHQLEEANTRLAELEPLAVEKAIRSAGIDPDTPAGKALARIAPPGSDADAVKALADELGFEPGSAKPVLTATEQAALSSADHMRALNDASTSEPPVTLVGLIKEAEAKEDWSTVTRLNSQLLAQQMAAKARG